MPTKPILKALVLADHVYQDLRTKKWIIAGTFNQIRGTKLPIVTSASYVYLALTDFRGPCEILLEIQFDQTNQVLARTQSLKFESEDPLQTTEIVLTLPGMQLSRAGTYSVNVLWRDEIIGSHRIAVSLIDQEGAK